MGIEGDADPRPSIDMIMVRPARTAAPPHLTKETVITTAQTLTRASVAILLLLALVAPFFGDSPTAVVIPLLLAATLAGADAAQRKKAAAQNAG